MDGKELFINYTSKRDYSGSKADEYAQLLTTIFYHIKTDIFQLLETAEAENKKLSLNENLPEFIDEYTIDDVVLI